MEKCITHHAGIDEAGRGPLAGPVTVGMVSVDKYFDKKLLRGVKDSKKLTAKQREMWFEKVKKWKKDGMLEYRVAHVGSGVIDKVGLSRAVRIGIKRALKDVPKTTHVSLDGLLSAPKSFISQETIIKGDEKVPLISLASVCAKVSRDRKMLRYDGLYPDYGFAFHKGYGTKGHKKAIKKHGLSPIHRASWNI